ncbi:MAG TPA: hypothetical protein VMZ27_07425 [Candidatus Saccharimonadales bacterium]|nr:hypothetical protein [Candidatus Saccharimonadales bacterium]
MPNNLFLLIGGVVVAGFVWSVITAKYSFEPTVRGKKRRNHQRVACKGARRMIILSAKTARA